ncbi:MAG: hypothetical protein IT256_01885 [Chitinophagaceae bacterium]|nr:hypothetical protein [Chitinophagaceae bacterium]
MKIILLSLFLCSSFVLLSSCKKLGGCKDEPLSLQKTDHNGSLRIDGFYYGDSSIAYQGIVSVDLIFFYRNGVIHAPGAPEYLKMKDYVMQTLNNPQNSVQYLWGLFKHSSDNIEIEKWLPRQCGYWVEYRSGKVLNDTTFELTYQKQSYKGEKSSGSINQIYHFRAFSPKPDSTNNFIK